MCRLVQLPDGRLSIESIEGESWQSRGAIPFRSGNELENPYWLKAHEALGQLNVLLMKKLIQDFKQAGAL